MRIESRVARTRKGRREDGRMDQLLRASEACDVERGTYEGAYGREELGLHRLPFRESASHQNRVISDFMGNFVRKAGERRRGADQRRGVERGCHASEKNATMRHRQRGLSIAIAWTYARPSVLYNNGRGISTDARMRRNRHTCCERSRRRDSNMLTASKVALPSTRDYHVLPLLVSLQPCHSPCAT